MKRQQARTKISQSGASKEEILKALKDLDNNGNAQQILNRLGANNSPKSVESKSEPKKEQPKPKKSFTISED